MFRPLNAIKLSYFLLTAFLAGVNSSFAQISQRQNMILESTFEGPGYLSGWFNSQHCCAYSVQQTTERVKAGSNALRLEIRKTDPQTSGSIRSEITVDADPLNQDRWYGFSMYLKDWVDDDAGEDVFQWHPDNDFGTASMALWTTGGRFTYVTSNNNSSSSATNVYTDIGPVLSNQWVDFVIHIRWATDTTGILQVWMNGNQVINRINSKTAAVTSYFKLGINKFGWSFQPSTVTQRILYFDEVRIGNASATYNDVAPFLPRRDFFQGL
jgi:hypothetical protein